MDFNKEIGLLLPKFKEILIKPQKFFKGLEKEDSYKSSVFYLLFITTVSFLLLLIGILLTQKTLLESNNIFNAFVVYYSSSFVTTFILSAILQLILIVFKLKDGFVKAFQIQVYSKTPGAILGGVPYLGILGIVWGVVLMYLGVKELYGLSKARTIIITAIWLVIVVVLPIFLLRIIPV